MSISGRKWRKVVAKGGKVVEKNLCDPECDLDYTPNKAVKTDLTLGISDSFGFGGHDACVAFRKYEG